MEKRPAPTPRSKRLWIAATLVGIALRLVLVPLSPRYGYTADHDDFARWGIQATDQGLLDLYDRPPPRWNFQSFESGELEITQRPLDRLCN